MVTIHDLIELNKAIEIGCMNCKVHLYIDPGWVRLPMDTGIPDVAGLIK